MSSTIPLQRLVSDADVSREAPPTPLKLCKDCRFCSGDLQFPRCTAPDSPRPVADVVTGELLPSSMSFCRVLRLGGQGCGPSGAWFEPLVLTEAEHDEIATLDGAA